MPCGANFQTVTHDPQRSSGCLIHSFGYAVTGARVKVPPAALTVLPEVITDDASSIATHWEQVRGEMGILLQSLQPNQLGRGLFRHPVSGWMTMRQAIAFLSAHLRHHGYQIDRLKYANRET